MGWGQGSSPEQLSSPDAGCSGPVLVKAGALHTVAKNAKLHLLLLSDRTAVRPGGAQSSEYLLQSAS